MDYMRKETTMNELRKAKCQECRRVFDLTEEEDAIEFYYGHDCEESE